MAVARSFTGGVTKSLGRGAIWGVFVPNDNALYSIAFETHSNGAVYDELCKND